MRHRGLEAEQPSSENLQTIGKPIQQFGQVEVRIDQGFAPVIRNTRASAPKPHSVPSQTLRRSIEVVCQQVVPDEGNLRQHPDRRTHRSILSLNLGQLAGDQGLEFEGAGHGKVEQERHGLYRRTGRGARPYSPSSLPAMARMSLRQFDALISRPLADWIGRAFIGYSRAKIPICSAEIPTGCFITIHSTPSLHGGVVSEPM